MFNFLQTKIEFSFTEINNDITEDTLKRISADTYPGISNIPTKILLQAKSKLIKILKTLFSEFSECMKSSYTLEIEVCCSDATFQKQM